MGMRLNDRSPVVQSNCELNIVWEGSTPEGQQKVAAISRPKSGTDDCLALAREENATGVSSLRPIPRAVTGKDLVSQLEYHDIVHRRTPKSQGREKRGSIGCNNVELKRSEFIPHYRVQYTRLV